MTQDGSRRAVVAAQDMDAAWDTWFTGWEQFLSAALALPSNPDAAAPATPSDPIPLGPLPPNMHARAVRAQAVRETAVAAVATRVAELRPGRVFTAAVAEPRPSRPLLDL